MQHFGPPRGAMGGPSLLGRPPMGGAPPASQQQQQQQQALGEPAAKRSKADDQLGRLLSESEFLATHQGTFTVMLTVSEPVEQFKIEAGRTVAINMKYSDKVRARDTNNIPLLMPRRLCLCLSGKERERECVCVVCV